MPPAVPALARVVIAALTAIAGLITVLPAAAASSSPGPGDDARYYRTTITAVTPDKPGISVAADASGDWIRVSNSTSTPLVVLGYAGEPYLQIGPSGVMENTGSLSSALNGTAIVSQLPQKGTVSPEHWVQRSAAPSYVWHDHRIHWMSATRPPQVASAPQKPHHVATWTVQMQYGGGPITVTGSLDWTGRPGPLTGAVSTLLWVAAALGSAFVTWQVMRGLRTQRRRSRPAATTPAPATALGDATEASGHTGHLEGAEPTAATPDPDGMTRP